MTIDVGVPVAMVEHAYTHFRITLHAFHARHVDGAPQAIGCADWRWVSLGELDAFPFPVTDQKIIAALRAEAAAMSVPGQPSGVI
jgi:adenine-specific DNA glycosylase